MRSLSILTIFNVSNNGCEITWESIPGAIEYDVSINGIISLATTQTNALLRWTPVVAPNCVELVVSAKDSRLERIAYTGFENSKPIRIYGSIESNPQVTTNFNPTEREFYNVIESDLPYKNNIHIYTDNIDVGNIADGFTHHNLQGDTRYTYRFLYLELDPVWMSYGNFSSDVHALSFPSIVETVRLLEPVGLSTVKIGWDEVEHATGYKVRFIRGNTSDDMQGVSPAEIDVGMNNFCVFDGLTPGVHYLAAVTAQNASGWQIMHANSPDANFQMLLRAPTNVQARQATITSFVLSWDRVLGAKYYTIFRDGVTIPEPFQWSAAGQPVQFPYPGKRCNVTVAACNPRGCSVRSAFVDATPAAPRDTEQLSIVESALTATQCVVTWSAVAGALYYKLTINGVENNTQYTSTTSMPISFPRFDVQMTVGVKAYNNGGASPMISIAISPAAPNAPVLALDDNATIQLVTDVGLVTPNIFWEITPGAQEYAIKIAASSNLNASGTLDTDIVKNDITNGEIDSQEQRRGYQLTKYDMGLFCGQKYYWQVQARNIGGGAWSSPRAFCTALETPDTACPSNFAVNVGLTPELSWSPSAFSGAVGDVAIVRVNSQPINGNDNFTIVALSDIPSGTMLKYTNCGWKANGGFFVNDAVTIQHAGLAKGATLNIASEIPLKSAGEQLFVFTGDIDALAWQSVGFLFGLHWGDEVGWSQDAVSVSTSSEPWPLSHSNVTNHYQASLALGNGMSWYYNGELSGTKRQILNNIANPSNWTQDTGRAVIAWTRQQFAVNEDLPLQWDVEYASSIELATSGLFTRTIDQNLMMTDTKWQILQELLPGIMYYWHVRSRSANVISQWSNVSRFTTQT